MLNHLSLHTELCIYGKCRERATNWCGHVLATHLRDEEPQSILAGWCEMHSQEHEDMGLISNDKGCYGSWHFGMGVKHL